MGERSVHNLGRRRGDWLLPGPDYIEVEKKKTIQTRHQLMAESQNLHRSSAQA